LCCSVWPTKCFHAEDKNKSIAHTHWPPTYLQRTYGSTAYMCYLHTAYNPTPYAHTNNPTLRAYPYTPTRYQIYTKSTYQPYKGPYTLNTDPAPTYLPYTPTNPTTCLHACHASDSQHHYLSAAPATLACYCAVHLRSTSHGILFAAKFMGETIALEFD